MSLSGPWERSRIVLVSYNSARLKDKGTLTNGIPGAHNSGVDVYHGRVLSSRVSILHLFDVNIYALDVEEPVRKRI